MIGGPSRCRRRRRRQHGARTPRDRCWAGTFLNLGPFTRSRPSGLQWASSPRSTAH